MGGRVVDASSDPSVTLVGIAHAGPNDLALTDDSEISIETLESKLHLIWLSSDRIINAAFAETELITYQEYEGRFVDVPTDVPSITDSDALGDLEDYPF